MTELELSAKNQGFQSNRLIQRRIVKNLKSMRRLQREIQRGDLNEEGKRNNCFTRV